MSIKDGAGDDYRKIDALLRFHFKIDPDQLTLDEWAKRWCELEYCLKLEAERFKINA